MIQSKVRLLWVLSGLEGDSPAQVIEEDAVAGAAPNVPILGTPRFLHLLSHISHRTTLSLREAHNIVG